VDHSLSHKFRGGGASDKAKTMTAQRNKRGKYDKLLNEMKNESVFMLLLLLLLLWRVKCTRRKIQANTISS